MTLVVQIEELGLLEAPMLGVTCLEELIERLPLLRLVSQIENWKYENQDQDPTS